MISLSISAEVLESVDKSGDGMFGVRLRFVAETSLLSSLVVSTLNSLLAIRLTGENVHGSAEISIVSSIEEEQYFEDIEGINGIKCTDCVNDSSSILEDMLPMF